MIMDYITFKNEKGKDVDMTDVSHFSRAYEFLISDQLDFGGWKIEVIQPASTQMLEIYFKNYYSYENLWLWYKFSDEKY